MRELMQDQINGLVVEIELLRKENERLRDDLKNMEGFAELWEFVTSEGYLDFSKIVEEYSPGSWIIQANKLLKEKRGG